MTTNINTGSAQNNLPPTIEVETLRQEVECMRVQMEEQRVQFTNILQQQALGAFATHNGPATALARLGQCPEPFKGTKVDRDTYVVKRWLDRMESYFETTGVSNELQKINLMRIYIVDSAGQELDTRIAE